MGKIEAVSTETSVLLYVLSLLFISTCLWLISGFNSASNKLAAPHNEWPCQK